jgi:hypothetical protein
MNLPIPSVSSIFELLKKGATLEAQEQIMKLREAAMTVQEENLSLREELRTLREQVEIDSSLRFEGTAYWREKDGAKDGPFCSCCYDEHKRLARLHDGRKYVGGTRWLCLVCSTPVD